MTGAAEQDSPLGWRHDDEHIDQLMSQYFPPGHDAETLTCADDPRRARVLALLADRIEEVTGRAAEDIAESSRFRRRPGAPKHQQSRGAPGGQALLPLERKAAAPPDEWVTPGLLGVSGIDVGCLCGKGWGVWACAVSPGLLWASVWWSVSLACSGGEMMEYAVCQQFWGVEGVARSVGRDVMSQQRS